ncbi:MAG: YidC/Oxa1 family membrane protein insertase [Actinomycetota bacterium]
MIASVPGFQELLNGMGWILARIYDVIPNWGLSIIALTVLIRVVLLPLGIKQIRSMQSMQIIQPKVKQIQQKYKGNKQKQQEEIMNLYREHGVNPFSGCWPTLVQFPILIAMYSVVRFPQYPVHIPADSSLYRAVTVQIPEPGTGQPSTQFLEAHNAKLTDGTWVVPERSSSGTNFLGMNLLCSAQQAGNASAQVTSKYRASDGKPIVYQLDCGSTIPKRIPYYFFALLMFGTTYFQQRQMQNASPPGASSQQQQALLKFMPLMFGVFGFFFPVGLVLYWTVSNGWQIGQQYFMLRTRPTAETLAAKADGRKERKGFMASMMERADSERKRRETGNGQALKKPPTTGGKPGTPPQRKPGSGGSGGSSGAGSRKKRPKR